MIIPLISIMIFGLFQSIPLQLNGQNNIIKNGREGDYKIYNHSSGLDTFYNNIRFALKLDSIHPWKNKQALSPSDFILQSLIIGEYKLKGPNKDDGKAYEHYLQAYHQSVEMEDEVLICESLKKLIACQIFTNNDKTTFEEYLQLHKESAYDRIELIYNEYYRLRGLSQFGYLEAKEVNIPDHIWQNLLKECNEHAYHRIATSIWAIYAVHLEVNAKNFIAAEEAYLKAIDAAQYVNSQVHENMQFISMANLGALHSNLGAYEKSLQYFMKAKSLKVVKQRPQNLVLIYKWISEAYKEIGQADSAYYYLHLSDSTNTTFELNKQMIAVNEIQEKYQNETLKLDLALKELQKNRYYLLVWVFGGLFIIGTILYFFYSRISRLKRINLQQNLVSLEKESLLRAIIAKIDGEEEERRRVASVLHDNISTHLAASRLHLKVIRKSPSTSQKYLDKTEGLLSEISTKVRKLSHELYPPSLYQLGLIPALESICEQYQNDQLEFHLTIDSSAKTLTKDQEIKLYFIIQEILNNVIKHSQASVCNIRFSESPDKIHISISDNGIGGVTMDKDSANSLGLYSVKARIEDMAGTLILKSPTGQGTEIVLSLPTKAS